MPALVAGIHAFLIIQKQDVDGRDEPGHDAIVIARSVSDEAIQGGLPDWIASLRSQ